MTTRTASARLLLALQWALAVVLFESGLVQAGLPVEALRQRFLLAPGVSEQALVLAGLAQVAAAIVLVVPTATGFLPGLAPLTAAGLAVALGAAGAGYALPLGLGLPGFTAALAGASLVVAVGRTFLAPVASAYHGPETRDPWHRPAAQLERLRRHEQAHRLPLNELVDRRKETTLAGRLDTLVVPQQAVRQGGGALQPQATA